MQTSRISAANSLFKCWMIKLTHYSVLQWSSLFSKTIYSSFPFQVMAAPQHEYPTKVVGGFSYTGIFNLLDYGAGIYWSLVIKISFKQIIGVVNVTKVTDEDDRKMVDYPESDPWYKMVKETTKVGLFKISFFPCNDIMTVRKACLFWNKTTRWFP